MGEQPQGNTVWSRTQEPEGLQVEGMVVRWVATQESRPGRPGPETRGSCLGWQRVWCLNGMSLPIR